MKIRVISFNIHKGYSLFKRRYTLDIVRELLKSYKPDIVLLQELHGLHPTIFGRDKTPLEDLADEHWPFYRHGINSAYKNNYHGNAILSRYPIKSWYNFDISTNPLEKRGLLHSQIELGKTRVIDVFCTHLNLAPPGQNRQIKFVLDQISPFNSDSSSILAGDFNDWTGSIRKTILRDSDLLAINKLRTFPSIAPVLSLDGFFYSSLKVTNYTKINDFKFYSDHLPLLVDCEF
jgi:endonuclease/exonuclease/phosphatase family metal-dependent hydrolase